MVKSLQHLINNNLATCGEMVIYAFDTIDDKTGEVYKTYYKPTKQYAVLHISYLRAAGLKTTDVRKCIVNMTIAKSVVCHVIERDVKWALRNGELLLPKEINNTVHGVPTTSVCIK